MNTSGRSDHAHRECSLGSRQSYQMPYFPAICCGLVRYAEDSPHYLLLGVLEVRELAHQVLLLGGEVEVPASAEVEEYGPPLACLPGFEREVYGSPYGVRDLRRASSLLFSFFLQIQIKSRQARRPSNS
jgi:hypothetical protein